MHDCTRNSQVIVEETAAVKDDGSSPELLWSIEDDSLFHPLGLSNHGTGSGKSVFVTWSEHYLLNFVFKRSKKTNKVNLTKVRLAIPLAEDTGEQEEILAILILELNTLLLTRSGRVYYFSSVKSMHNIPWLCGVRCIAKAPEGFSVIRLLPASNRICLEVYRDVVNLGKCDATLVASYDITFDEQNLFNCLWRDECMSLLTQMVVAENLHFLEQVIGKCCQLEVGQCVHFFNVSSSVFALIATTPKDDQDVTDSADYHIQLLNTYASDVDTMKINNVQKLFLVFLKCGTIDVWFVSRIARAVQRKVFHTGTQYTHYDFVMSDNCMFFYTDEERVAQLRFHYDDAVDNCVVVENLKCLPGILACTWVNAIQQLVCLSANNIFYQISFESAKDTNKHLDSDETVAEYEDLSELYELTPAKIAKLEQNAQTINEFVEMPAQMHTAIEKEFIKQQLIAVAGKTRIYMQLIEAKLVYTLYMPASSQFQKDTVHIHTAGQEPTYGSNSVLALIHLKITQNDIFQATLWHIHIDYDGTTHLLSVPHTLLHKNLCVSIPLVRASGRLLPEFSVRLLAFVASDHNYLAITLPIELRETACTYGQLFSLTTTTLALDTEFSIADLVAAYNKEALPSTLPPHNITHNLQLPHDINFKKILAIFDAVEAEQNDLLKSDLELVVYFMSSTVKIVYNETNNCLHLVSTDAVALYYTQMYIIYNLKEIVVDCEQSSSTVHTLLQYQCELERCYGTLMETNDSSLSSSALHLENLKRIYTKLRTELYTKFR